MKGSDFERYIAKTLSKWWTDNEREDIFWRTSQSGGRATTRKKAGKTTANQDGDLCATDPIGQPLINLTSIELKKGYNGWTIKEMIDSRGTRNKTLLETFFAQANREAESQEKSCWWLICRQDRREILIFVNCGFWKWLRRKIEPPNFTYISILHCEFGPIYVMKLDIFLTIVKPEFFI